MDHVLLDLEVTRVDLVDDGANSESFIKIYKRKEGGKAMTFEEILESLDEEQQKVVKAAIEDARNNEDLQKKLTEAEARIRELEEAKETPKEDSEEEIMKNLDPAVKAIIEKSRARAKAAEDMVRKMMEKEIEAEAIAKARDVAEVGVPEEELSTLYKSLKDKDSKLAEEVFKVLKTASEVIKNSKAFEEIGTGQEDAEDADAAWAKIESKAAEIAKARNITIEAATAEAISENPDLYKNYVKAQ